MLGETAIARLGKRDVQRAVNQWNETLSARTVRRVYGTLNAILNYAIDLELIVRAPSRGVKLPAAQPETHRLPSPDQLAELAATLGPDHAPLVYLGAVLGLRWGECAGLRVGRIDFIRATLTVAEQVTRGRHGEPITGPPKSHAGNRTLSMPPQLVEMLSTHLARRGLTGADPNALVFTMPDGGPLAYQNWRTRVWRPALESVGLEGLGFHDLRRLNATGLVMEGVDVKTAQARLGHSDPRLTLAVYAQATSEADRAAAERLGDRFMTPSMNRTRDGRAME
jgi:integrase